MSGRHPYDQASGDMATLVESFLWLAREASVPECEPVCATGVILQRCIDLHRPLLGDRPVRVTADLACPSHPGISPHLFRIAVSNLVRNACQYTRSGEIRVVSRPDRIEVLDTGPGFDPARIAAARTSSPPGTDSHGFGFGLSIVDRIAACCGWRLDMETRPEGGTVARLWLAPPDRSPG